MSDLIERPTDAADPTYPDAERCAQTLENCEDDLLTEAQFVRWQGQEIERLTAELETERMRLAACGVMALANTEQSAAKAREMLPEYRSASLADVERAVDREMQLRAERDELRRKLAEAEQRFDWLTERLEDVQIDDADPNDHYYGDEEDVPYPVLWRRAIDEAMGATRPAEES